MLKGYNLNEDLAKAFREATMRFPDLLDTIILDDNGLREKYDS